MPREGGLERPHDRRHGAQARSRHVARGRDAAGGALDGCGELHAALARDDVAEADDLARTALSMAAQQGERQGIASALLTLAAVAAARHRPEPAAELAGASATIRESIAARDLPFEVAIPARLVRQIENATEPLRWRQSWDAGRALDKDSAIARALASSSLVPAANPG